MEFVPTHIPAVVQVRPRVFGDARGFFLEDWNQRAFEAAGITAPFVQINQSRSVRGTLRGLHYQVRQPQGKLVWVVKGAVFDVAVDIRRSSSTFGQWVGRTLSEENHELLWVPPGFAHGFMVLSESADFQYACTDFYSPTDERSIRWNDPTLAIRWPTLDIAPVLSPKDAVAPAFTDAEVYE